MPHQVSYEDVAQWIGVKLVGAEDIGQGVEISIILVKDQAKRSEPPTTNIQYHPPTSHIGYWILCVPRYVEYLP